MLYCIVSPIFANKCAAHNFKFAYKQKSKTEELRSAAKISFTLCYLFFAPVLVDFYSPVLLGFFSPLCDLIIFTCLLVALFSAVLFDFFALCSLVSLRHCVSCCLFPRLLVGSNRAIPGQTGPFRVKPGQSGSRFCTSIRVIPDQTGPFRVKPSQSGSGRF